MSINNRKESELDIVFQETLTKLGEKKVLAELVRLLENDQPSETLTIISNHGVHHLPDEFKRGEVFVVTEGNLDLSSASAVQKQYEQALTKLADKLKSENWKRIFLVPFGPSTLSMQIKLLVYRITSIETIDVFYAGSGTYFDLEMPFLRKLIVEA